MRLSLSLSLSLSLPILARWIVFSHHSEQMFQRSQVSKIVLSGCSLNVFVIVIVFVFVFVFVFAEKVWKSGSERLHWSISCDPTEKMPVHKSEIWYREIQLVKIKKSISARGLQKGGESSGRPSLGDCDSICEGNLVFRVIFWKFMHRWFQICAQLGSYNLSFLHYRPPKLKYDFFRGSFARLTSQSQGPCLGFWGVSLTIKYLFVSSIRSSSVYHGLFSAVAMDLAELHITCKKKLNRKTFERPNICYVFEKLGV